MRVKISVVSLAQFFDMAIPGGIYLLHHDWPYLIGLSSFLLILLFTVLIFVLSIACIQIFLFICSILSRYLCPKTIQTRAHIRPCSRVVN